MKLNAKDIASGVVLILIAAIGLYLNQDHALGSARRMGPGYMPMLVFWIQIGLGAIVLAMAFFNGPDPLEKWVGIDVIALALSIIVGVAVWQVSGHFGEFFTSTYNGVGIGMLAGFVVLAISAGWSMTAWICAAMCVFGLLLEKGGLMLATIGTVAVSAVAEPEHRQKPLGVLGMIVFLSALCWWIFIKQLDIRVAVWPQF